MVLEFRNGYTLVLLRVCLLSSLEAEKKEQVSTCSQGLPESPSGQKKKKKGLHRID